VAHARVVLWYKALGWNTTLSRHNMDQDVHWRKQIVYDRAARHGCYYNLDALDHSSHDYIWALVPELPKTLAVVATST
jgi:hypothetical protein